MITDWPAVFAFLAKAVVISFSGVLAPGPMTAATFAAGTRHRHAGALLAVGHGLIELPLMLLIMLGMGRLFAVEGVKLGIGLTGGAVLLMMAAAMVRYLRRLSPGGPQAADPPPRRSPILTGVLLSAGNPYFLLWWATIGLALATQAAELGALAFGLFALIHWLCDLAYLEALSLASFKGAKIMGDKRQKIVLAVCAAALILFGLKFITDAAQKLLAG